MRQQALLERVSLTTARVVEETQKRAAAKIIDIEQARKRSALRERARVWHRERWERRRSGLVLTGLKALSSLAKSEEVQRFMEVSNRDIVLWTGDHVLGGEGGKWQCISHIVLGRRRISLRDYILIGEEEEPLEPENMIVIDLDYEHEQLWSRSKWLHRQCCWTMPVPIWFDEETGQPERMYDHVQTADILWDILADCANPRKLEQHISSAL